jgi:hypothetical protein
MDVAGTVMPTVTTPQRLPVTKNIGCRSFPGLLKETEKTRKDCAQKDGK